MDKWIKIPSKETIDKTIASLKKNNFNVIFAKNSKEAKKLFFELLPKGAEVMNNTSLTLNTTEISKEITDSGKYNSVRNKLMAMNRKTQNKEMQQVGSSPEWSVGSVHAVTEDGHVLIASRTGSQLAGYVYGATHIIWVVGVQKIVKNINEGIQRIYEHSLQMENERVKIAYGLERSEVDKILIFERESNPERINLILVNEALGF